MTTKDDPWVDERSGAIGIHGDLHAESCGTYMNQSLDNDVVLSMKQANVPAVSRFVDTDAVERSFENEAHRTVVSQRALQSHTDPLLGWTTLDGAGYVVSDLSPYEVDLDWGELNEPDEIAGSVEGRRKAFVADLTDFALEYADRVRRDHALFVEPFRAGRVGVTAT